MLELEITEIAKTKSKILQQKNPFLLYPFPVPDPFCPGLPL